MCNSKGKNCTKDSVDYYHNLPCAMVLTELVSNMNNITLIFIQMEQTTEKQRDIISIETGIFAMWTRYMTRYIIYECIILLRALILVENNI